jgi:transcriptional regulator with XRE-family HTH domain
MQRFIYRLGMVTQRDRDERQAFLAAFGRFLKLERVKRGMSQEEFADLIGVHRTFMGQLERGQRATNIAELPRMARSLGLKPRDLIPEPEDDENPPAKGRRLHG